MSIMLTSMIVEQFLSLWEPERATLPISTTYSLKTSLIEIAFLVGLPRTMLKGLGDPLVALVLCHMPRKTTTNLSPIPKENA